MSVLIEAEIHGLAGRAGELRELLAEHVGRLAEADGSLGASAFAPVDADAGSFVLQSWWNDEDALRAHYASPVYARYVQLVGELLARPSDVRVHYVERSVRATADPSNDPARQG